MKAHTPRAGVLGREDEEPLLEEGRGACAAKTALSSLWTCCDAGDHTVHVQLEGTRDARLQA